MNIIADLRKVATVGVVTDGDMPAGVHRGNIVIESTKMHVRQHLHHRTQVLVQPSATIC